jgi:hypothetical protein
VNLTQLVETLHYAGLKFEPQNIPFIHPKSGIDSHWVTGLKTKYQKLFNLCIFFSKFIGDLNLYSYINNYEYSDYFCNYT